MEEDARFQKIYTSPEDVYLLPGVAQLASATDIFVQIQITQFPPVRLQNLMQCRQNYFKLNKIAGCFETSLLASVYVEGILGRTDLLTGAI